jgi:hypothetical protein
MRPEDWQRPKEGWGGSAEEQQHGRLFEIDGSLWIWLPMVATLAGIVLLLRLRE